MSDLDNEEIEATKKLNLKEQIEFIKKIANSTTKEEILQTIKELEIVNEKTADEMFEELGYVLKIDNEEEIIYLCIGNEDLDIRFFKKYKVIAGTPTYYYFCDIPLLQAINKKCKELGWLDE